MVDLFKDDPRLERRNTFTMRVITRDLNGVRITLILNKHEVPVNAEVDGKSLELTFDGENLTDVFGINKIPLEFFMLLESMGFCVSNHFCPSQRPPIPGLYMGINNN